RMEVISTGDGLNGLKPIAERGTQDLQMNRWSLTSSPTGRALAVMVNDADAVYPVRIDPTFSDANWVSLGGVPGANGEVSATVVDGSGNLYIGGGFTVVGDTNANNVAKWNGSRWSALGSGMTGPVLALAVSGANVYAGGSFTNAGGSAANYVARWNGSSWSALGLGVSSSVYALAVSGSTVYAGGLFTNAGGNAANYVARWNGSSWSALSSGMNNYLYALAVSGSTVYAGGLFTNAGGIPASYIAKWDGSSWSALGSGMGGDYPYPYGYGYVYSLAVSGSDLYAGGAFTTAGGRAARSIAKWDGSNWSALGSGLNDSVVALAVSDTNLYAGSYNSVARWDASSWSALGSGTGGDYPWVNALAVSGTNVYVGGAFSTAGGSAASGVA